MLYLLFVAALVIDITLFPLVATGWLPYLSLALLPPIALYASPKQSRIVVALATLFIWLTTAINLGVLVLGMGLFILFEEWFLGRFFRHEAWQTPVISSLGLVVPGVVFVAGDALTTAASIGVFSTFTIRLLVTIAVAIGFSYLWHAKTNTV